MYLFVCMLLVNQKLNSLKNAFEFVDVGNGLAMLFVHFADDLKGNTCCVQIQVNIVTLVEKKNT